MRKLITLAATAALVASTAVLSPSQAVDTVSLGEFQIAPDRLDVLRQRFVERLRSTYPEGTWAPLRAELDDADLALMGLPARSELTGRRYAKPTRARRGEPVEPANGAVVAGAGWAGIRPGAWLLFITEDTIGWCSAAHVYGSPASYQVATAGHCGPVGSVVTMLGAIEQGGEVVPALVDIGTMSVSHVDGRRDDELASDDRHLGNDWGLIDVYDHLQGLVEPSMPVWGGPTAMFTARGDVLPTQIAHYGHGTAIGAGGTPRTGTAMTWADDHFTFFGAITPGDSGSAANVVVDPTDGGAMEAGGIITHLWIDSTMGEGLGIMGGTRATVVGRPLATALVPMPAPLPA